jgi:hypothetical protein
MQNHPFFKPGLIPIRNWHARACFWVAFNGHQTSQGPFPLDRALMLRHLCLCVAARVAYWLKAELRLGPWFVGIAGLTFLHNLS